MDEETLRRILKEELKPIETRLENLEVNVAEIKTDVKEIKAMLIDLESTNATRHTETNLKIEELKRDMNKVEVVTSKNCFEIEYLKAVK